MEVEERWEVVMKVCGEFPVEMVFKVCSKVRVEVGKKWKVVEKVGGEFNEEVGEKWLVVVIVDVVAKAGGKFRMKVVVQVVEEFMSEIQSLEWKWWRNGKWQSYAHFHSASL